MSGAWNENVQGQLRLLSETDDQLQCAFPAHRPTGRRFKNLCGAAYLPVDDHFRSGRNSEAAIAGSGVLPEVPEHRNHCELLVTRTISTTIGTALRYQFSWLGRISTSKDHADGS